MKQSLNTDGEKISSFKKPEIIKIPLIFNTLTDYSIIKNIILIDNKVKNYKSFFNNGNNETFPIIYDCTSPNDELLTIFTPLHI
jgi:hypothetical protein